MSFAHLHVHSYYSFLQGLASPAELARSAANTGMQALALTDHLVLTGAIEFHNACIEQGIKPLLGLELDITAPARPGSGSPYEGVLVFLAEDSAGWRSLCRLSSAALARPEGPRSLPIESLARESAGLICLTGGVLGLIARSLENGHPDLAQAQLAQLEQIFPQRLYLELPPGASHNAGLRQELRELSRRTRVPMLAAQDIYQISAEQDEMRRLVTAMRQNSPLPEGQDPSVGPSIAYFMSPQEIESRYADNPQAIQAAGEIVERCQPVLPVGLPHLPTYDTPPGVEADQLLRMKAESGAIHFYGSITPAVQERLDHELSVIERLGYAALFLIVEDILSFARANSVPYSSRGSAASSLVAHCLGISSPDPLRLNLYFERFLNPARATLPDIDIDLCSRRRDEVIDYVYRKFGSQRVAMVCTINRFRRRSALREVGKAHGLPPAEISRMADSLPSRWYGPSDQEAPEEPAYADLAGKYPSPRYQAIFRQAAALLGIPHHLSIHPGGIVISPGEITDLAPLQLASKGVMITQFDLDSIEQLGLVKIDLLGIRGLTVLGDVVEAIRTQKVPHVRSRLERLDDIPEADQDTSLLVKNGQTIGCFQIESPGMRLTLREIQASSLDDVMVALALYRPGPLTGGQKDNFIRRFQGAEATTYLHPSLAPLLDDTYGVILYQEQVLRIAHQLAGLSLADADLLRRAMSHFDPGQQMQTLKEKFIQGTYQLHHIQSSTAEQLWDLMAAFAGYGFPKAHAASYARIAWRSAWCKAHFPAIFMAAVLANWGGYYSQSNYLTEARRMGLSLKPPHVNHALHEFSVSYLEGKPVLFMGLDQVRDLTSATQKRIMGRRPFRTFEDFLSRADPRLAEAENLVKSGALEGMGTIPALLLRLRLGGWQGGQLSLFDATETGEQDLSIGEKARLQQEILGASVIVHRLELFSDQIAASQAVTTVDAARRIGQRVSVAGIRQFWRRSNSSVGEPVYFMSLEDLEGMLQVLVSAEVYRRSRSELRQAGPFVIEGTVEMDPGQIEPKLRAERIWSIGYSPEA